MKLTLIEPTTLLGRELREHLGEHAGRFTELELVTSTEELKGTLTEIGGTATLVKGLVIDDLEGAGVVVYCGSDPAESERLYEQTDRQSHWITAAQSSGSAESTTVVAGTVASGDRDNDDGGLEAGLYSSPHPATVLLARLAAPLRPMGLSRMSATVIEPASMEDEGGIQEVFEQSRALLNFATPPTDIFGHQHAFNIVPSVRSGARVADEVHTLLADVEVSVHLLSAGLFHACSASVELAFRDPVSPEDVRAALLESEPFAEAERPDTLGPVDAAGSEKILFGGIDPLPHHPNSLRIWLVMDNLTVGGAHNVLSILDRILS